MNRLIALLFVIALAFTMISGCSTLGISTDTQAKLCTDARSIVASSKLALSRPDLSQAAKDELRWDKEAAQVIVDANCGDVK